jgi:hypothetical protein
MLQSRRKILSFILVMISLHAGAQHEDCAHSLSRAINEFQEGHFYRVSPLVKKCMPYFSKEQRQRANLLLVQTYLLLDSVERAKQSYVEILKINPEFALSDNIHPMDVVYLGRQFTAAPRFSYFLTLGANVAPIHVIHASAFSNGASEKYSLKIGYQSALGGEFYINRHWGIRGMIGYALTRSLHERQNDFGGDMEDVQAQQRWISLPVSFFYQGSEGKYRPYGYVGYGIDLLLSDIGKITITTLDAEGNRSSVRSPAIRFTENRRKVNPLIHLGAGMKYKTGLNYCLINIQYGFGLRNRVKSKDVYYTHVENYFRMDNFSVSVGFIKPIYKPRAIKAY